MSETADVLDALVNHPGWQLLLDQATKEWSPAACWEKAKEVAFVGVLPLERIAQVDYTNQQVGILLNWPKQEAARLRREEQKPERTATRRGGL